MKATLRLIGAIAACVIAAAPGLAHAQSFSLPDLGGLTK